MILHIHVYYIAKMFKVEQYVGGIILHLLDLTFKAFIYSGSKVKMVAMHA